MFMIVHVIFMIFMIRSIRRRRARRARRHRRRRRRPSVRRLRKSSQLVVIKGITVTALIARRINNVNKKI